MFLADLIELPLNLSFLIYIRIHLFSLILNIYSPTFLSKFTMLSTKLVHFKIGDVNGINALLYGSNTFKVYILGVLVILMSKSIVSLSIGFHLYIY